MDKYYKMTTADVNNMNMKNMINSLWSWGHFNNVNYPCDITTENNVPKLSLKDNVVKYAIKSYQEFFAEELMELCQKYHGRTLIIDGKIGPAILELLNKPRCGCRDHPINQKIEANWPEPCRHEITTSYLFDRMNLDDKTIKESWVLALKSWEDIIKLKFKLGETFSRNSRIWATDGALPGSVLAWSMLAYSNCSANLEQRYDTLVQWSLKFLQSTICHEVGHALGSGHLRTRDSIMYPSITSVIIPTQNDVKNMIRLGYKENNDPTPPEPEPDTKLPNWGTNKFL